MKLCYFYNMKLSFEPHTLKFRHPFTLSNSSRDSTPVVFTTLHHEGVTGYGEASMPPYLGESHESVTKFLTMAQPVIERWNDMKDIGSMLEEIDAMAGKSTAAKASIDIALHDLYGKLVNKPCHSLFGADPALAPYSSYTIGIDTDQGVIAQKVEESGEFRILKVKMGTASDRMMIETIRSVTSKAMSVDVNQGWTDKHEALELIHWLKEMGVLFVEQPMAASEIDSCAWLTERSPLPVIADEAVQRLTDIDRIRNAYHGINIKLMKCTGMHEAFKMIARARELDMKVLIGCMSESSCAVSAAAQLSPLADWADLDGPLLMREDPFEGITFESGRIKLNDKPGIGVRRRE